jgi:branched-chain amino acid transport system substrate-binding protein
VKYFLAKFIVPILLVSPLLASCSAAAKSNLPAKITLGAVVDLTGATSSYGTSIQKGIDLAVSQINDQAFFGEDHTLSVNYEDAAGDSQQAVTAFNKLIANAEIVAILGPTLSAEALVADPLAQQAGMPVIASSNTVAGIVEIGNYIFRTSLPESTVIPNTLQVVKTALNLTKVAILYENDDAYTQGSYETFKAALQTEGIEILAEETYSKGTTDFTTQLNKIKSLAPDAIVVSAYVEEAAEIMTQARALGIPETVRFIGGNGFNSPKLAQIAGAAAEGAISGSAWNQSSAFPASVDFVTAFTALYGTAPDQFAAQAYTAAWVTATAILNAGSVDHAAVRDALAQIQDFNSPLGVFSFDADRNPVHDPVVLTVQNGEFVVFQP